MKEIFMEQLIKEFKEAKKKFRYYKKEIFESQNMIELCRGEIAIEKAILTKTRKIRHFLRHKILTIQKVSHKNYLKGLFRRYAEQVKNHQNEISEYKEEEQMHLDDIVEYQSTADTIFSDMKAMVIDNPELASFVDTSFLQLQAPLEAATQLMS
jgi:hypothetical protein